MTKSGEIPAWVLNRKRLRILQTSPGFLKPDEKPKTVNSTPEERPVKPTNRWTGTIGERLERWGRLGVFRRGNSYRQIEFGSNYCAVLAEKVINIASEGRYLGSGKVLIETPEQIREWLQSQNAYYLSQTGP